tara:strand:- start:321 stop:653 length:333 start_codon:yes stop_codon:yes gene_type:complete
MSENDGIQFTKEEKKVGTFLKDLWKGFFWILDKSFKIILWIAIIIGIHYALSTIAKRSTFLITQRYDSLAPYKMTLYKISDWKLPPIIGPLIVCIPIFLIKIYWNIRTFL